MSSEESRPFLYRDPVDKLKAFLVARFDQFRRMTLEARRRRARSRRIFENKCPVEPDFFDQRKCLTEVVLGLTWKSDDDIRAERHARHRPPHFRSKLQILFSRVIAKHLLQ